MGEREEPAVPEGSGEPMAGFVGCDETIERLYFYLDGELTEQRRVEITRHLDMCGPCVGAGLADRAGRRGPPQRAQHPGPLNRRATAGSAEGTPVGPLIAPVGRRSLHWSP